MGQSFTVLLLLSSILTFVMQATESALLICFNNSLLSYGGNIAVGSMTIISSTSMFMVLPLQGIGQGAQPIMSYSYGAENTERVKKSLFPALESKFWLVGNFLDSVARIPPSVCKHFHHRSYASVLHQNNFKDLLRRHGSDGNPDGVPNDVCFTWTHQGIDHRRIGTQIGASHPPDLSDADSHAPEQDSCGLPCRTDCRYRRHHIHRNSVCDAISKNPCQRPSNQKSKKNVTLMTRLSP